MAKKLAQIVWLSIFVLVGLAAPQEALPAKAKLPDHYNLKVKVIDKEDGSPVEGATVGYSLLVTAFEQETGADGAASVDVKSPGKYSVYVKHKYFSSVTRDLVITKESPANLEIVIALARREEVKIVKIRLMDTQGNPIPEGRVYLEGDKFAAIYTGETDSSGCIRWYVTHGGNYSLSVYHGHFKSYRGTLEIKKYGAQKEYGLQVTLEREEKAKEEPIMRKLRLEVRGKDLDGNIKILPKATVYFGWMAKKTDRSGVAVFDHSLDIGTYCKVLVEAKDFEPKTESFIIAQDGTGPLVHRPTKHSRIGRWIYDKMGILRPPENTVRVTLNTARDTIDFIVDVRDRKDDKFIENCNVTIKLREPMVVDGTPREFYAEYIARYGRAKFSLPIAILDNIGSLRVYAVGYETKWVDVPRELLKISEKPSEFAVFMKKVGEKEEGQTEKALVFAVKGRDPEGKSKPLPDATVVFQGEGRKTDNNGMAEFTLPVTKGVDTMRVEASAEAKGYEPADVREDVRWETGTAVVTIVLNQKTAPNLIVAVRTTDDKPVAGARVQVRLKSDTARSEAEATSDSSGEAKIFVPSSILGKALFVAVSHPDYEDAWSDVSLDIPSRSGPGTEDVRYFVVHLKKKGQKEAPPAAEEANKTLIFSVKGRDPDGSVKPLKGALVSYRKLYNLFTDAEGKAEYKLHAVNPTLVVETYTEAEGYAPKDTWDEVSWKGLNNAIVDIVLNKATPPNFTVNVQTYQYAPIKDALVQVRLKTDVNRSEAQARTDKDGVAKISIPKMFLDTPLFVAATHPDQEETWNDIPPEYLAAAAAGIMKEFYVHMPPKYSRWVLVPVIDPHKKANLPDANGDLWTFTSPFSGKAVNNLYPLTRKSITLVEPPPAEVKSYQRFNFTVEVTCDTDDLPHSSVGAEIQRTNSLRFWLSSEPETETRGNFIMSTSGKHARQSVRFTAYIDEHFYEIQPEPSVGDTRFQIPSGQCDRDPGFFIVVGESKPYGWRSLVKYLYKKK